MFEYRPARTLNESARMIALACIAAVSLSTGFDNAPSLAAPADECDVANSCVIEYAADFFQRYNPVTALDMVRNVPGFKIDDGDGSRGFGGAAGNILIDGERPAVKSETPSDILSRTPVSTVARIDVIRGQAGGLDLRGQSVVVNVILKEGAAAAAAWELSGTVNLDASKARPSGEFSYSDRRGALSYTVGVEAGRLRFYDAGTERLLGSSNELLEVREEIFEDDGFDAEGSLNAALKAGSSVIRLNASLAYYEEDGGEESARFPVAGGAPFFVLQGDGEDEFSAEIGADVERPFGDAVTAKLIGLYRRDDFTETGSLAVGPSVQDAVLSDISRFETLDTETIVRLEIDYSGFQGHLIEVSAEGAVNRLESAFSLLENGADGLAPVDVPGANTEVEEVRGDFSISNSLTLGPAALDAVFAAETSTIEQTGEFEAERSFFFLKPSLTATLSPLPDTQLRLRGLREVGQLDFFDFVSSTDFDDEELALGNPELSPEATWTADATVERRFGEIGVVSVTAFYDWVEDVQDFLPIGEGLEAPGNIGDGRRWGLRTEGAAPLDWMGLKNSRLDFSGELQDSSVTDPVTGEERRFADERRWEGNVAFRQDLTAQRWAWGGDVSFFDEEVFFGLDELDADRRRADLDAFIETTRLGGVRVRLGAENILSEGRVRDRTVFGGARGSAPQLFREARARSFGREVFLSVSGNF